eukprot:1069872-Rhodomonas_salina.1
MHWDYSDLDFRVNKDFPIDYYCKHCLLVIGGMINSKGTGGTPEHSIKTGCEGCKTAKTALQDECAKAVLLHNHTHLAFNKESSVLLLVLPVPGRHAFLRLTQGLNTWIETSQTEGWDEPKTLLAEELEELEFWAENLPVMASCAKLMWQLSQQELLLRMKAGEHVVDATLSTDTSWMGWGAIFKHMGEDGTK